MIRGTVACCPSPGSVRSGSIFGSWYTVDQTERGACFATARYRHTATGLGFKVPLARGRRANIVKTSTYTWTR